MVPDPLSVFLVGLPAARRAVVRDALPLAFRFASTHLVTFSSLEDAFRSAGEEPIVAVVDAANDDELVRLLQVEDARGLPRVAIVLRGDSPRAPGVEVVNDADFEPRLLARALSSAWAALQMRRAFVRERGDVWSLGRRVTHDLRNPLGCIVTTAEMLKESLAEDAPEHLPLVESVLESTGEMLELLNRIHLVAKASAQPKAAERFDMGAAVQAAVDRLQREITERKAQVIMPEVWPEVSAVRPWIESMWADLMANALRHGGEQARVELGWRREPTRWVFSISDRGPGVASERVPFLFTPFHRLHTRHGGGLGLSMVHRLAELQNGECSYLPREGGGAVFVFALPAEPSSPTVKPAAVAGLASHNAGSIASDQFAPSPTPAG